MALKRFVIVFVDFGLRNWDWGLDSKMLHNAFRGSCSDFLTAVGVSGRFGVFSWLIRDLRRLRIGDCGMRIVMAAIELVCCRHISFLLSFSNHIYFSYIFSPEISLPFAFSFSIGMSSFISSNSLFTRSFQPSSNGANRSVSFVASKISLSVVLSTNAFNASYSKPLFCANTVNFSDNCFSLSDSLDCGNDDNSEQDAKNYGECNDVVAVIIFRKFLVKLPLKFFEAFVVHIILFPVLIGLFDGFYNLLHKFFLSLI